MREVVLTAASLALTGAVVANAYFQKHQFYPSVVYLTKSSPSMAVLYIQAFVLVILLGKMMRKVFFGQLRAAEMEHLIERSWYAVTETCLAFTVFRDDFSPRFVAQFTLLLFLKCFHWLAEDRIDYMERSPVLSWLFHMRAVLLLMFLGMVDAVLVHIAYNTTMQNGASVQLVFGFEYAILLTIVVTIQMKYVLHIIDLRSENPWDNKAVYLLYTELITGFIKTVLYSCFMVIMIKVHTFPLFAIRPMYLTLRGFKKCISDVIMSRRAIRNMNTLYPDATPEELQQGDNVCIICREEMTTGCKKLPCNHIFHTSCLRSWFQRQQTCPTCRMDVLRPQPPPAPPQPPQPGPQPPFGFPPMGIPPPMGLHPTPGVLPQFPLHAAPGMFPGWPPMGVPPVPPGQPPAAGAAGPTPAPGASPAATAPGTSNLPQDAAQAQMPGFGIPPPFMFPPPFMMPPFMLGGLSSPINMDFSSLNIEQLVAVEGQERQNVEARINMLRTIHALLDAAIIQLNQYSQMINEQRVEITRKCKNGHSQKWVSSEVLGVKNNAKFFLNDSLLAAAIIISGNNYSKFALMCKALGLNTISINTFTRFQKHCAAPVVKEIWNKMNLMIIDILKQYDEVCLCGDGRNDSPGHSARYCVYTLMEHASKVVVDMAVIDKRETGGNSVTMEKEGLRRLLEKIATVLPFSELTTDASTSIMKLVREMKENFPQLLELFHSLDIWHKAKKLSKCLHQAARVKGCEPLKEWIDDIINHFWFCCQSCEGSVDELKKTWFGVLHHVCGEHQWAGGACKHSADATEAVGKTYLQKSSKALAALRKVVLDKTWLKNFEFYVRFRHTSVLESYNSMLTKYAPKRMAFEYPYFIMRIMLAAIDHNMHLSRGEQMNASGEQRGHRKYSKRTQKFHAEIVKEEKSYRYFPFLMAKMLRERCLLDGSFSQSTDDNLFDPKQIAPTIGMKAAPSTEELMKGPSRLSKPAPSTASNQNASE